MAWSPPQPARCRPPRRGGRPREPAHPTRCRCRPPWPTHKCCEAAYWPAGRPTVRQALLGQCRQALASNCCAVLSRAAQPHRTVLRSSQLIPLAIPPPRHPRLRLLIPTFVYLHLLFLLLAPPIHPLVALVCSSLPVVVATAAPPSRPPRALPRPFESTSLNPSGNNADW